MLHARYVAPMAPPIRLPFSGKKLRAARERKMLTQQDLADLTGIPQERLSRYENSHTVPSVKVFRALVRALQGEPADLLDETEAGAA